MFCNQCGAKLPDGASFCMNCGARLPVVAAAPAAKKEPFTVERTVTQQQIDNGERIEISGPRLPRTARLRLQSWMGDGSLVSVTPGEGSSYFDEFFVRLKVVAAAPAAKKEPFTVERTVTQQQIDNGERIEISGPRLPRTARLRLQSWMGDGSLVSVTPGEGNSYFDEFFVRLKVVPATGTTQTLLFSGTRGSSSSGPRTMTFSSSGTPTVTPGTPAPASSPAPRASAPAPAATPTRSVTPPVSTPTRSATPPVSTPTRSVTPPVSTPTRSATPSAPTPAPRVSTPTPASRPAASTALLATSHCVFRLAEAEKLNSFKMGGDDNGNVDVYGDRLEIFKKSAGVAMAFGAIGSAIEGKGKLFFTLTPAMVSRYQPMQDRKGNTVGYTFTLRDGRMLRLVMDRKSQAVPAIPRAFGG